MSPREALPLIRKLIEALLDNAALREWFEGLAPLAETARYSGIAAQAERMIAENQPADLVRAVEFLAQPGMYDRVLAAFQAARSALQK